MRWQDVMRQLDGTEIQPVQPGAAQVCMLCSGPVDGYADRRPVVCARCVARELGTTPYAMALATEFGLSIKVVEARLERYGGPGVSPKEWLTPRTRLRRVGG